MNVRRKPTPRRTTAPVAPRVAVHRTVRPDGKLTVLLLPERRLKVTSGEFAGQELFVERVNLGNGPPTYTLGGPWRPTGRNYFNRLSIVTHVQGDLSHVELLTEPGGLLGRAKLLF